MLIPADFSSQHYCQVVPKFQIWVGYFQLSLFSHLLISCISSQFLPLISISFVIDVSIQFSVFHFYV